jgi:hypothetical protein
MTVEIAVYVALAAALLYAVWWIDSRLLQDLAATPDHVLRRFDRRTWTFIILFSFPVGPMLYLRFGKDGSGRYL